MTNICNKCGTKDNLTKHHTKNKILILCRDCHDRIHNMDSTPKSKRWSNEDIEKLMTLYRKKKSYNELAKELGRTRSACYTMVHNVKMFVDNSSNKIRRLNSESNKEVQE